MSNIVVLTPHQCEAVSWAVERIHDGATLCAIRGLAGTGKTTLIPALRDILRSQHITTQVGSPTHRAAMILRKKGIPDATTLHTLALTPYFLGDYAWAHRWLGEDCPSRVGQIEERTPDVNGVPYLLATATDKPKGLMARVRKYGVKKVMDSLGIKVTDYLDGFGPKQCEGVLIVDEASMLGGDTLAKVQQAFPQVLLIGDPGQLPPVRDALVLDSVEAFDLTEIHRQAADSPILQLAYAAREGRHYGKSLQDDTEQVSEVSTADASDFLTAPLLVWKNETRLECTKAIRAALGMWLTRLYVGEPLVCRATSAAERAQGLLNNSLWRIAAVEGDDYRTLAIYEEGAEDKPLTVRAHMEELDGDEVDPEATVFRFGYALTCHTAQGGEWPLVYIDKRDMLDYISACKRKKTTEDRQWAYTAITRAKTTLRFLTERRFIAPEEETPMPMTLSKTKHIVVEASSEPVEALSLEPDDLADPPVPEGTTTALEAFTAPPTVPALSDQTLSMANGFCQYVQSLLNTQLTDAGIKMARGVEDTISEMANFSKGVLAANEHAQYSFADALSKIVAVHKPYTVRISAVSSAGFPVELTIQKETAGELVEELGRLVPWLTANGYSAEAVVSAA